MVASELPSATPQTSNAPAGAFAAATPASADAGSDTTAFSSLLTQMLGSNTAIADATAAAVAAQNTVTKGVVQKVDSDSDANAAAAAQLAATALPLGAAPKIPSIKGVAKKMDKEPDATADAAAAQLAGAALPLVVGIAQIIGNTLAAPAANGSNQTPSAGVSVAAAGATALAASAQSLVAQSQVAQSQVAQSQRATATSDIVTADNLLKTTTADAQMQFSQIVSANAAVDSPLGSGGTSTGDGKTGKQDSNAKLDAASAVNNTTQLQNTASRTELQVEARVGTPAWRDEVGAKLTWMTSRGIQQGTLHLSPDNLGPLEVHITTQNSQVSVWFGAAHADTRAALENALPRLREMFATQGMSLSDAGVFREPPKDTPRSYTTSRSDMQGISSIDTPTVANVGRRDGILDAYA